MGMGGTSVESAKALIIVANYQCAVILSPKRIAIGLIADNNELGPGTREHLLAELGEPGHVPMAPRDIGNNAHSGRRGTLKPNVMQEVQARPNDSRIHPSTSELGIYRLTARPQAIRLGIGVRSGGCVANPPVIHHAGNCAHRARRKRGEQNHVEILRSIK